MSDSVLSEHSAYTCVPEITTPAVFTEDQGQIQAHAGAQRFAMVSGLNDMFPGDGVRQSLRYVIFLFGGCVKNVTPISSNMYKNFDRKDLMDYNQPEMQTTVSMTIFTQLSTHCWPITKQCLILFSMWCKKVTLAIQEKKIY